MKGDPSGKTFIMEFASSGLIRRESAPRIRATGQRAASICGIGSPSASRAIGTDRTAKSSPRRRPLSRGPERTPGDKVRDKQIGAALRGGEAKSRQRRFQASIDAMRLQLARARRGAPRALGALAQTLEREDRRIDEDRGVEPVAMLGRQSNGDSAAEGMADDDRGPARREQACGARDLERLRYEKLARVCHANPDPPIPDHDIGHNPPLPGQIGAMNEYQSACAPLPCSSSSPGARFRPHARVSMRAPATVTNARSAAWANACANQAGACGLAPRKAASGASVCRASIRFESLDKSGRIGARGAACEMIECSVCA